MVPLIHDTDISISNHEDVFDKKTSCSPLHERTPSPRVSFYPMTMTYDVLNLDDYSNEELNSSFYNPDDMLRMKKAVRAAGKFLANGRLPKHVPTRGIENRTREGMKRKRQARIDTYAAVFLESDTQKKLGMYCEELIANAYSFYSETSARAARLMGKQDELEAMAIHKNQTTASLENELQKSIVDLELSSSSSSLASSAA
jgi:hypothetical protein